MRRLGFHVSIAGSVLDLVPRALERRCTTVQMFTTSPSQWAVKPLDPAVAPAFRAALLAADIQPHFVHAIYLLNLASADPVLGERSINHLAEELRRAELLGAAGVILHCGSAGAEGHVSAAVKRLARGLVEARRRSRTTVPLVLENGAGAGNTLGGDLEQLAEVIARAGAAEPLRLCLDTAHAFAAGLPIHTEEGLEATLTRLDELFTPERLLVLHCNDSRYDFHTHHDRHWHLGKGYIGREAMRRIVNHPRLAPLPFIMETPGTVEDDRRNMYAIRRLLPQEERPKLRRWRR
ncbi:MAG TPA: deoxyribonuclease IV [Armatimonadota bacterium]|jgi:deoxyribonuclease-4